MSEIRFDGTPITDAELLEICNTQIAELEAKVARLEKELVTQTTVLQYWYDYGYDRNQNENLLFGRTTLEVE